MFNRKSRGDLVRELSTSSLRDYGAAFVYLDYSGVIVRTASGTVAFDVADLLKSEEISALKSLDLLLFAHTHWDHYKPKKTLELFSATGTHLVAEPLVAKDLEGKIPPDKLTSAVPGETYTIGGFKISTVSGATVYR